MHDTATAVDDGKLIDVRGFFSRRVIDILDAVAAATPGESRVGLLRQITSQWCEREILKASLIQRVALVERDERTLHVPDSATDAGASAAAGDASTADNWKTKFLAQLEAEDKSILAWCHERGFEPSTVYRVLRGKTSCRTGTSRAALIAMGGVPPSRYGAADEPASMEADGALSGRDFPADLST